MVRWKVQFGGWTEVLWRRGSCWWNVHGKHGGGAIVDVLGQFTLVVVVSWSRCVDERMSMIRVGCYACRKLSIRVKVNFVKENHTCLLFFLLNVPSVLSLFLFPVLSALFFQKSILSKNVLYYLAPSLLFFLNISFIFVIIFKSKWLLFLLFFLNLSGSEQLTNLWLLLSVIISFKHFLN